MGLKFPIVLPRYLEHAMHAEDMERRLLMVTLSYTSCTEARSCCNAHLVLRSLIGINQSFTSKLVMQLLQCTRALPMAPLWHGNDCPHSKAHSHQLGPNKVIMTAQYVLTMTGMHAAAHDACTSHGCLTVGPIVICKS